MIKLLQPSLALFLSLLSLAGFILIAYLVSSQQIRALPESK
ncbi:hypothetical protein [Peribacillus butanolivorans]|nr:hypothetical protein [Peribacillus butanolivorans]